MNVLPMPWEPLARRESSGSAPLGGPAESAEQWGERGPTRNWNVTCNVLVVTGSSDNIQTM